MFYIRGSSPKKTRMLRTVDSERKPGDTVVQKLHRAIKLAAVMANLCPFLVPFFGQAKKYKKRADGH